MFTVDRSGFIAWNGGILLKREDNNFIVVNDRECQEADSALERGELVGLREKGEIVSYMKLHKGTIVELSAFTQEDFNRDIAGA
jgi:hypothetical protein